MARLPKACFSLRLIPWIAAGSLLVPVSGLAALRSGEGVRLLQRPGDAAVLLAKRGRRKRPRAKKTPPPPPSQPTPPPPRASGGDDGGGGVIMTTRRGPARVDFDDRLIQGQTNKSGAIYIFERKSSELHSMVRRRTSFRAEILRSIE